MNDKTDLTSGREDDVKEFAHLKVPSGFVLNKTPSPFSQINGPTFDTIIDGQPVRGFRVEKRHCNRAGIVHGGMMMTFADMVLGSACWDVTDRTAVTIRMTTDFISMARPGDWVEARADVTRQTSSLIFASGQINVGQRLVMTMSGIFKPVGRPRK